MKIAFRKERRVQEFCVKRAVLCLLPLAALTVMSSHAAGLNDTGQTLCYEAVNAPVACSALVGGDAGVNPRQDARYGRDAAAAAGRLSKVGGGSAGFDYTKIANNGSTLPATATLGIAATSWACTRDNVTGLIWEVKINGDVPTSCSSDLRGACHLYTWRSSDATSNGGNAGVVGNDTCGGSLAAAPYNNQCNTQNFIAAVNAVGLCGASDWRLPSHGELLTIVHAGNAYPVIDTAYFPDIYPDTFGCCDYWTKTTSANNAGFVRLVAFGLFNDLSSDADKSYANWSVRLVRGGR